MMELVTVRNSPPTLLGSTSQTNRDKSVLWSCLEICLWDLSWNVRDNQQHSLITVNLLPPYTLLFLSLSLILSFFKLDCRFHSHHGIFSPDWSVYLLSFSSEYIRQVKMYTFQHMNRHTSIFSILTSMCFILSGFIFFGSTWGIFSGLKIWVFGRQLKACLHLSLNW